MKLKTFLIFIILAVFELVSLIHCSYFKSAPQPKIPWGSGHDFFHQKFLYEITGKAVYQNGQKICDLKSAKIKNDYWVLESLSGFTFDNIPTDNTYFFNEAVYTFLEAEKLLPLAREWLDSEDYQSKSLKGLKFFFPKNPLVDLNNQTSFWSPERGYWIFGQVDNGMAIVTSKFGRDKSNVLHEYMHLCGYTNNDHHLPIFDKGCQRSFYEKMIVKP